MLEIELSHGVKLQMPEGLEEMTVSQYCEYLEAVVSFVDWQNSTLGADDLLSPSYQLERLSRMAAMVQAFCLETPGAVKLSDLLAMPVGDYSKSLTASFGVDRLEDLDLDATEGTLYSLWAYITRAVLSADLLAVGDSLSFEWKGERYFVKEMNRDRMTGRELPPSLSVQEAVEVLELRRKANNLIETGKYETKNIKWELFHRQLAILALREGETLPADDLEFERFVADRAAHFVGIDAATALKVDFFLAGVCGLLRATLIATSFSTLRDPKTSAKQRRAASSNRKTRRLPKGSVSAGFIAG